MFLFYRQTYANSNRLIYLHIYLVLKVETALPPRKRISQFLKSRRKSSLCTPPLLFCVFQITETKATEFCLHISSFFLFFFSCLFCFASNYWFWVSSHHWLQYSKTYFPRNIAFGGWERKWIKWNENLHNEASKPSLPYRLLILS